MNDPSIFTLQIAAHSRNERPKENEEIVALYQFSDWPPATVSGQYTNGEFWYNESELPWHHVQLWMNAGDLAKALLQAKLLDESDRFISIEHKVVEPEEMMIPLRRTRFGEGPTPIEIQNNTDDRTVTIQGVDLPPNHQAIVEGNKITVSPRTEL